MCCFLGLENRIMRPHACIWSMVARHASCTHVKNKRGQKKKERERESKQGATRISTSRARGSLIIPSSSEGLLCSATAATYYLPTPNNRSNFRSAYQPPVSGTFSLRTNQPSGNQPAVLFLSEQINTSQNYSSSLNMCSCLLLTAL
jgi:hypothetical protein